MGVLATDNFDRANANPIGAPWTTGNGESAMQIVGNVATPSTTATDCGADYTGITWPADQYAKAKLSCVGIAGGGSGACLKVRSASGARTYYRLEVDHAATNNVFLEKCVAAAFTPLTGFPLTQAWTDGDTWELWAVGNQVWVILNGALVGSKATDSAVTSGNPGIGYSSVETSASINDWEGGGFDTPFTPLTTFVRRLLLLCAAPFGLGNPLREVKYGQLAVDVTGGANTPVSLDVASTFSPALVAQSTYQRTLSVASGWAISLSRGVSYLRTLSVTTTWTPAIGRLAARFRSLAVSSTFTAALVKFFTRPLTLSASGTWTASMSRARGMLIAVASPFSATLSRVAAYFRALSAASTFAVALRRNITKNLSAASTFTPSMIFGRAYQRVVAAGSTFTAAVARRLTYARLLSASSSFAASITERFALNRSLSVTSPFTASIGKRFAVQIGLSVAGFFAAALDKIKTTFGLQTSSLDGNIQNYPRLAGDARSYVRLAGNTQNYSRLAGVSQTFARLTGNARTHARLDGTVRNYPKAA